MKNLKDKIQDALRIRKTSLKKLAEESGIPEQTIYYIYKSNDAKVSQLQQIASALGIPVGELLDEPATSNTASAQIGAIAGGSGHSQTIMPGGTYQVRTGSQEAEGSDLATCLSEKASLQRELSMALEMISTQKQLITALQGSPAR